MTPVDRVFFLNGDVYLTAAKPTRIEFADIIFENIEERFFLILFTARPSLVGWRSSLIGWRPSLSKLLKLVLHK